MLSVACGPVSCRAAQAGGMCRIINNALDYLCYAGPSCNQLFICSHKVYDRSEVTLGT